ncbi:hypothetical protein FH966_02685 [Lentibacillus cibarius]|uniref:Uncharacterized protein n=1 Tax=Lentibacillus cibarius TaxID=2583219 RepID=A0A549YFT1_9BACI|nr:hypothetical protein [Lentibacillus cibarius]TRM10708.1 hypothetical protein FH966_02685 [Lentibacillus cibarius]
MTVDDVLRILPFQILGPNEMNVLKDNKDEATNKLDEVVKTCESTIEEIKRTQKNEEYLPLYNDLKKRILEVCQELQ